MVGEKGLDLRRFGRQPGQVERGPPQQGEPGRPPGARVSPFCLQFLQDEGVDRVAHPIGMSRPWGPEPACGGRKAQKSRSLSVTRGSGVGGGDVRRDGTSAPAAIHRASSSVSAGSIGLTLPSTSRSGGGIWPARILSDEQAFLRLARNDRRPRFAAAEHGRFGAEIQARLLAAIHDRPCSAAAGSGSRRAGSRWRSSRTPSSGSSLERSGASLDPSSDQGDLHIGEAVFAVRGHRPFANFLVEQTLTRLARNDHRSGLSAFADSRGGVQYQLPLVRTLAVTSRAFGTEQWRCLPGTTGSPRAIRRRPMQIGPPRV